MSLDGFITGPSGDMSWLTPYLGLNPQIDSLQRDIGALLVGNRTFRGDDPNRGTAKEGAFGGTLAARSSWSRMRHSSRCRESPSPRASPMASPRREPAAGDRYVNVLGADIARQCLEAGELDEAEGHLCDTIMEWIVSLGGTAPRGDTGSARPMPCT